MRGIDGTSWNNKRLDFVPDAFHVSRHLAECHTDEASNIFTNDPSWPDFRYNPEHCRPEVAVIVLALLLPGNGKRLTGETATNEVNGINSICPESFGCDCSHVVINWHSRKILSQHGLRVRLDFAECNSLHASPVQSKEKPAYAAE
jgi:hypothetical protein